MRDPLRSPVTGVSPAPEKSQPGQRRRQRALQGFRAQRQVFSPPTTNRRHSVIEQKYNATIMSFAPLHRHAEVGVRACGSR